MAGMHRHAAPRVDLKGPRKDAKNLENIRAGNVVELTYTQALAVSLDKPTTP